MFKLDTMYRFKFKKQQDNSMNVIANEQEYKRFKLTSLNRL